MYTVGVRKVPIFSPSSPTIPALSYNVMIVVAGSSPNSLTKRFSRCT
jgi:hypothetical protein